MCDRLNLLSINYTEEDKQVCEGSRSVLKAAGLPEVNLRQPPSLFRVLSV